FKFSPTPSFLTLTVGPYASPNHLIRSCQHVGRDGQPDLLSRLQIDYELDFHRLFYRDISRLRTLQNLHHIGASAAVVVGIVRRVGHQTSSVHSLGASIHRRHSVLSREIHDTLHVRIDEGFGRRMRAWARSLNAASNALSKSLELCTSRNWSRRRSSCA